ncbi:hypothetical protein JCGZ_05201 [Jatropha curcas]|uniref:Uncharacterized protein n=1 Tax=Jatropha curcas TaxID=180498 RepID=A0A067L1F4_JATCU|nr:hypothetical protein JCGZ_05201 [Jatropha curcas]
MAGISVCLCSKFCNLTSMFNCLTTEVEGTSVVAVVVDGTTGATVAAASSPDCITFFFANGPVAEVGTDRNQMRKEDTAVGSSEEWQQEFRRTVALSATESDRKREGDADGG